MQAYSLYRRVCKEFPNAKVEIIDYSVSRVQKKYSYKRMEYIFAPFLCMQKDTIMPNIKASIKNVLQCVTDLEFMKKRKRMRKAFDSCFSKISLSERALCSDNVEKATALLNSLEYDMIIVGSDCVWEFNNYPFPNVYFLNEVTNVCKMSYAACAQGILYEDLSAKELDYMRSSWDKFDYIGVRDVATETLVCNILPDKKVHHNCDPTVFLEMEDIEINVEELKRKLSNKGIDFAKPIVGLMANENIGKLCREIVGDDVQIVSVYEESKDADVFLCDLTPFEWAKCFSLFQVLFTDRFHGTLLALKNGINTLTFDIAANDYKGIDKGHTKIFDLYSRLNMLEGHYYIAKTAYTDEEREEIRQNYMRFMRQDNRENIFKALEKEEESASIFFKQAKSILCDKER